ncbi:PREDICTED: alpha-sarcoglycan isoform X2 [Papilio xuthus]|uniref:Alpha-sarcoglycan isoform X2 n=1 Tax=Papilio xuthus TaxID=66420 RepID=A0AAJ6Z4P2_PAPXU|nr:PREDICTED: alpha-sarcoglycan isoform X2 [Papilio xuthus]
MVMMSYLGLVSTANNAIITKMRVLLTLTLLTAVVYSQNINNAVETEMFAVPITPNLFNWTYQEFEEQYRFHASLKGKPELPSWLRYVYSSRHHSGFIFGTPPRGTESSITLEVIGLNRQDYETRRVLVVLNVKPKENMARHEVELKIDNLNVEDLLDDHRMTRLKDILRMKLWTESKEDLYPTFLSSAIDLGARLPLKPSDGEGLVVRLGSSIPFSSELKRLREEVRPLSRLPSCPREYKRTTVERLFRDAGFTLDWCSFELYNTIYKPRSTIHLEYLTELPNTSRISSTRVLDRQQWSAPERRALPQRSVARQLVAAVAPPLLLLCVAIAALTAVLCFRYAAMTDPESEYFLENIYHICIDYRKKRAQKTGRVELCRYGTGNTDQTQVNDNNSNKSLGVSPNNSLVRPYSPKSSTNLAGSYNRPQPPPYIGSTNNSLHHRRSGNTTTPSTSGHTPEHNRTLALEESLKLLNEANITGNYDGIPKDPIIDLNDGTEDYVLVKPDFIQSKPDLTGYNSIKPDLDDINVPELAKYGVTGIGM